MAFDVVGIGEALIEFAEVEPNRYVQSFAGDTLNSLYYATRLGLHTSFYSTIGGDTFSTDLLNFFDENGIDRSSLKRSTKNNGLYIIRTDSNGEPTYTFFRDDSAARTMFDSVSDDEFEHAADDATVLLFSAIGLGASNNRERFIDLIVRRPTNQLVFFDTNVRRTQWNDMGALRSYVKMLAPRIDVLSTSRSDDEAMFGSRPADEALEYYRQLGIQRIILRQGSDPVETLFDTTRQTFVVPPAPRVIDTTGAGDAFNAAFIAAFLKTQDTAVAVRIGIQAAIQVIGYRGGIVPQFDPALVTSTV